MPRPRQFVLLAASLAAVAAGCAHCDTCDDFPAPCTGPNCGYPYQSTFPYDGGSNLEPIVTGPGGEVYYEDLPPGAVMGAPSNGSGTPSIVPPPPTPADSSPSGNGQGRSSGGTTPPDSPPALPNGGDPFNIPMPSGDSGSPFGNGASS